ncbi:hypothetical protein [Acinetobacter sp. ANC 5414]|uniref:tetratricopeptide repeat protein n=1 Tax=Acinetobacter sp. ANC 5414 TaxID=2731251 RepID=UPI001BE4E0EB|nr:hypothetical protein [Acinetobacter sp. ANC 5414]
MNKADLDKAILDYIKAKMMNETDVLEAIYQKDDLWDQKYFVKQLRLIELYILTHDIKKLVDLDSSVIESKYFSNFFENVCDEAKAKKYLANREYEKILRKYDNSLHNNIEILKACCEASFRLKKFLRCKEISTIILSQKDDYYISELMAESCIKLNALDEAYKYLKKAIDINPKLISARVKMLTIAAQKGIKITTSEIKNFQKIALNKKKNDWIRDLAYIQSAYGMYEESISNIEQINIENRTVFDSLCLTYNYEKKKDYQRSEYFRQKAENESFKYSYEDNNKDNLLIVFSSTVKFELRKYEYDADKIFVADTSMSMYIYSHELIFKRIIEEIGKKKYKKISVVGLSKGGCGAILVSKLLRENTDFEINISVVVFSTQIKIYPYNPNLVFQTYRNFMKYIAINPNLMNYPNSLYDLSKLDFEKENYKITFIYGNGFPMDVEEMKHIQTSKSVEKLELAYSGHGTSIPLTIPEGKTYDNLQSMYSKLNITENDFKELGGNKVGSLVDEIYEIYKNPVMRLSTFL